MNLRGILSISDKILSIFEGDNLLEIYTLEGLEDEFVELEYNGITYDLNLNKHPEGESYSLVIYLGDIGDSDYKELPLKIED